MIDRWLLPGPAALVGNVVSHLIEGHHVCMSQELEGSGLRRALEDALAARQRQMLLVFDDSGQSPRALLLRAVSDGILAPKNLRAGIYWVDGMRVERGAIWADEVGNIAEFGRNLDPWARPLIVLLLPGGVPKPRGLDVVEPSAGLLSRLDLEVAARYALAEMPVLTIKDRIRAELAIQLAAPLLPLLGALESLDYWLGAPDDVLGNPDRVSGYAEAGGSSLPKGRLGLSLWRAQFAVLMTEIDAERLRLIERASSLWQLPYTHPAFEGRPEKVVELPEALELSHLCRQLRLNGRRAGDPVLRRLELLRDVRNSLSHLEMVNQTELEQLIDGR